MTWTITRNETEKLHQNEQITSLLANNQKIKDPKIVANAFNNLFSPVTEQLTFRNLASHI